MIELVIVVWALQSIICLKAFVMIFQKTPVYEPAPLHISITAFLMSVGYFVCLIFLGMEAIQ